RNPPGAVSRAGQAERRRRERRFSGTLASFRSPSGRHTAEERLAVVPPPAAIRELGRAREPSDPRLGVVCLFEQSRGECLVSYGIPVSAFGRSASPSCLLR